VDSEPDTNPEDIEEGEVVDGLPVLPGEAVAALAATGFVAGAATVAVVAARRGRSARKRRRRKGVVGEIVGSNSFLVDVHLVRRS
jgi:hypothetical protein